MEYQKIINLLDDKTTQPSKFGERTAQIVKLNLIKYNYYMLKSNLRNYSDVYILVKGRITSTGAGTDAAARQVDERNKGVIFTNCAPFTDCVREINNIQVDNAKYLNVVMPMHNFIACSDNYSKISGS